MAKIEEEVAELRETLDDEPRNAARAEEEMGDLLFAIANLSRKLGIEPEAALRKANEKFTRRFNEVEQHFADVRPEPRRRDAGGDGSGVGASEQGPRMNTKIHEGREDPRRT